MIVRTLLAVLAAAFLVVGCSSGSPAGRADASTATTAALVAPQGFPTGTLAVTRPDGSTGQLSVLVADTPARRQEGLMAVTDPGLGGNDAMVFVFPGDTNSAFWMKDTVLPLAIASGASAGSQRAIGTGVMGGMITATVLAVFFVPVFFVFITKIFSRKAKAPQAEATPSEPTPSPAE